MIPFSSYWHNLGIFLFRENKSKHRKRKGNGNERKNETSNIKFNKRIIIKIVKMEKRKIIKGQKGREIS